MNWHETIELIRGKSEFDELVQNSYFDSVLENNIERFRKSSEFDETLKLIREYAPTAKDLLDIGAGNGVSSINFALQGFMVTAIEPDPSDTVGANAIRKLVSSYQLNNVIIHEKFAEEINFPDESFDLVYIRQAMHHAYNLKAFVSEAARVLKKGGILMTVRDHVIFNKKDKDYFLQNHALHKFYGGENAFSPTEYKQAFANSNLKLIKEIKYFESVINYFPKTDTSIQSFKKDAFESLRKSLSQKIGMLSKIPFFLTLYRLKNGYKIDDDHFFEKIIPGRMYSYILQK